MVPFMDLRRQHDPIRADLDRAIGRTIDASAFTLGAEVEVFENEFAVYCGTAAAVGVGSGTDALFLALAACGVTTGDEVITAPNTFIATAEAISMCGARPVFVDIDPLGFNIDPARIEAAITSKTRAIVPIHLFGHPADMDPIMDIARRHRLKVVEDACQAHGAVYKGRRVGSIGDAGCFSFYPGKNLGALGDGGMVVSDDSALVAAIRLMRSHGEAQKNCHTVVGRCSRLHGLQAAVLRPKLARLDEWNRERQELAAQYTRLLGSVKSVVMPSPEPAHVYHLYVIRVPERDRLRGRLVDAGIQTGIHYPTPIHLQPAYADLNYRPGDFPVSEMVAKEILSLPIFPGLRTTEIAETAEAVGRHIGELRTHGAEKEVAA